MGRVGISLETADAFPVCVLPPIYLHTCRPPRLSSSSSLLSSSSCGSSCQKTPPSREELPPRQRPQPFEDFETQSLFVSRESESESAPHVRAYTRIVAGIINTPICLHSSSYKVSQTHPSVARPSIRPSVRRSALSIFSTVSRFLSSLPPPLPFFPRQKDGKKTVSGTEERERDRRRDRRRRRRRRSSRRRDGRVACVRRTGRVISSALFCLSLLVSFSLCSFLHISLCCPSSSYFFLSFFFFLLLLLSLPSFFSYFLRGG